MAETNRDDIAKLEALYVENPEGRVFIHLAEAYRRAGELDRALEVVKDGISRYADDSSAHVVLGRVLEDRQQDEEAAAAFSRVLELDAHNLVALRGLGDLAFRAGDHQAALQYFERLAEIEPPDGELEALIEALRSGPAGMAEALEQWGESGSAETAPRGEAVDFAGGTQPGGVVEPEPQAASAGPTESPMTPVSSTGAEVGVVGDDEGWVRSGTEEPAPEGAESEEPSSSAPGPASLEAETPESPWQGAGAGTDEPGTSGGGEPGAVSGTVEGLQPEDELRGAEAAGTVESVEVTERDLHDEAPPEGGLPAIGGVEGLQTAETPLASGPFPDGTWATDEEPKDEAEEATQTVFTETMAQVYARQGLYDRAADVYKELLRQRPGDAALETRLAEMQELGSAAGVGAEAAEAPAPEEPFPFLDALPTSDGGAAVAEVVEEPQEVEEPREPVYTQEPEDGGETESAAVPVPEQEAEAAEKPIVGGGAEQDFAGTPGPIKAFEYTGPEAGEPAHPEEPAVAEAPVHDEEPAPLPEEAYSTEPSSAEELAEDVESVWTGADGAVAGEETPYSWTEPAEQEAQEVVAGEGIRNYLQRLAGWPSGAGEVVAEPSALEPAEATDAPNVLEVEAPPEAQEAEEAAEPGTPPADAQAAPRGPGGTPSGEDDDLDMFRAWLESLKR